MLSCFVHVSCHLSFCISVKGCMTSFSWLGCDGHLAVESCFYFLIKSYTPGLAFSEISHTLGLAFSVISHTLVS